MLASLVLGALLAAAPSAAGAPVPAPVAATATAPAEPAARGLLPTPQFVHFDMSDGLPSSAINAVVQDQRGFMWFGGSGGLSRYDGVEFTTYRHDPGNPDSLSSNDITQLVCNGDGTVWVATGSGGLDRVDPATGKFAHWAHDDNDPNSLASDVVSALALAADGSLWVGTREGIDHLSADGRHISHVPYLQALGIHSTNPRDKMIGALHMDADGMLWAGTWSGLLFKRHPDGRWQRVAMQPVAGDVPMQVWRINGSGSDLRIDTRLGLLKIAADGVARPVFTKDQLAPSYVFDTARDHAGRLWMATLHGVVMQDRHGALHHFPSQPLVVGGLPGKWTWRVITDREGGLWFTFYDGGVAYLAPGWEGFSRYTHIPDDADSLRDTLATVVAPSADGKLWVGERGKLDKLDPATSKVEHVADNLGSEVVSIADTGDAVWFTVRGSLYRYRDHQLVNLNASQQLFKRPEMITAGPDHTLYITVRPEGVVRFDTRTLKATPVPMPPDAVDVDLRPAGLDVEDGVLWYANHQGLMRWNAAHGRLEFVPGIGTDSGVLAFTALTGTFWLLREDRIEHYHMEGGRAVRDHVVGAAQGWESPVTMGMNEDRDGRLWLFTQTGLLRYTPATGQFRRYGAQDGLANDEFESDAVQITPHGAWFAANHGGVIAFDPMALKDHTVAPLLAVVGLTVRGANGVRTLPTDTRDIRLDWSDRDLRIGVRALAYVDPRANRYRFKLVGLDDGWVDTGNRGDREFVGLRPGNYTLQVEARGAGGQWGRLDVPLRIHVATPPWLRWWAWLTYALLTALLLGLVLWTWRRRLAQTHRIALSEQARQLAEQASAAKTRFLATLSHEIRTPMTGVMGMAELLLETPLAPKQRDYTCAMQRSGGMLLKLLNDALDLVRIDAGRFELEIAAYSPRQLVDDVAQLEQGVAWSRGLAFHTEAADLPVRVLGDAMRIKQVLLNLVGNALKFTERGTVTLRAQRDGDELTFSVIDTGPGIPEGSQARLFERFEQEDSPQRRVGSGLGLAICRELVEMMGGSIELQSRLGHGSTFRVRLPLRAAADEPPAVAPAPAPHGLDVLLVEDDPTVAAVIVGMLEGQGMQVTHVANGLLALAELDRRPRDLVLLDLDLPGVDGFQIARLIRQREDGAQVPIIAVTARTTATDEAEAAAAGMDGFLRKPLTGAQLAAAMARVLDIGHTRAARVEPDPA